MATHTPAELRWAARELAAAAARPGSSRPAEPRHSTDRDDELTSTPIRAGRLSGCAPSCRLHAPLRGLFVTGHRHRGRQDSRRFGDRRHAGRARRARGRLQAGRHRSRRARRRAARPRAAARLGTLAPSGSTRSLRTASARRVTASGRELAGTRIDPALLVAAQRARGRRRRRADRRGRRRPVGAAHAGVPGARLRRRPRPAARDRGAPRPRHDQPHAADRRVRARSRARRGRASCFTRGPRTPARSSSPTGRRSRGSAGVASRRSARCYTGPPINPAGDLPVDDGSRGRLPRPVRRRFTRRRLRPHRTSTKVIRQGSTPTLHHAGAGWD